MGTMTLEKELIKFLSTKDEDGNFQVYGIHSIRDYFNQHSSVSVEKTINHLLESNKLEKPRRGYYKLANLEDVKNLEAANVAEVVLEEKPKEKRGRKKRSREISISAPEVPNDVIGSNELSVDSNAKNEVVGEVKNESETNQSHFAEG
jgi:hypothetical protein